MIMFCAFYLNELKRNIITLNSNMIEIVLQRKYVSLGKFNVHVCRDFIAFQMNDVSK